MRNYFSIALVVLLSAFASHKTLADTVAFASGSSANIQVRDNLIQVENVDPLNTVYHLLTPTQALEFLEILAESVFYGLNDPLAQYEVTPVFPESTNGGSMSAVITRENSIIEIENQYLNGAPASVHHMATYPEVLTYIRSLSAAVREIL